MLYFGCISAGMLPDTFWGCTLAEASSFMKGVSNRDSMLWNHTSSLMALYAQSKSKRGTKVTAKQFHPYQQGMDAAPTMESRSKLLAKFKNF